MLIAHHSIYSISQDDNAINRDVPIDVSHELGMNFELKGKESSSAAGIAVITVRILIVSIFPIFPGRYHFILTLWKHDH